MIYKELKKLILNYDDINTKRIELVEELKILESYTGVTSPKIDAMIASGQRKSICDRIEEKEKLKQRIFKLEVKLNKFKYALSTLNEIETNILFLTYGKHKKSIKEIEGTKQVNYFMKTRIYEIREQALKKMYNYINEVADN